MDKAPWDIGNHLGEFSESAVGVKNGRIFGYFVIGNYYKRKEGYYGEYPPGYLKRVFSLFPKRRRVLHAFAGTVKIPGQDTIDENPELDPTILGRVEDLPSLTQCKYDLILADPPYSRIDAQQYGIRYPNKAACLKSLREVADSGCILCWLDTSKPRWANRDWTWRGGIVLDCGSNRRLRVLSMFEASGRI